jgi:hypothetical protein
LRPLQSLVTNGEARADEQQPILSGVHRKSELSAPTHETHATAFALDTRSSLLSLFSTPIKSLRHRRSMIAHVNNNTAGPERNDSEAPTPKSKPTVREAQPRPSSLEAIHGLSSAEATRRPSPESNSINTAESVIPAPAVNISIQPMSLRHLIHSEQRGLVRSNSDDDPFVSAPPSPLLRLAIGRPAKEETPIALADRLSAAHISDIGSVVHRPHWWKQRGPLEKSITSDSSLEDTISRAPILSDHGRIVTKEELIVHAANDECEVSMKKAVIPTADDCRDHSLSNKDLPVQKREARGTRRSSRGSFFLSHVPIYSKAFSYASATARNGERKSVPPREHEEEKYARISWLNEYDHRIGDSDNKTLSPLPRESSESYDHNATISGGRAKTIGIDLSEPILLRRPKPAAPTPGALRLKGAKLRRKEMPKSTSQLTMEPFPTAETSTKYNTPGTYNYISTSPRITASYTNRYTTTKHSSGHHKEMSELSMTTSASTYSDDMPPIQRMRSLSMSSADSSYSNAILHPWARDTDYATSQISLVSSTSKRAVESSTTKVALERRTAIKSLKASVENVAPLTEIKAESLNKRWAAGNK